VEVNMMSAVSTVGGDPMFGADDMIPVLLMVTLQAREAEGCCLLTKSSASLIRPAQQPTTKHQCWIQGNYRYPVRFGSMVDTDTFPESHDRVFVAMLVESKTQTNCRVYSKRAVTAVLIN
jgi:hypothetical protein